MDCCKGAKMKRILYVEDIGKIGGAEKILYILLSNLNKERYHPVVVFGSEGPLVKAIKDLGIECHTIKMKEMRKIEITLKKITIYNPVPILLNICQFVVLIVKLVSFFKKNGKFDLVHTNTIQSQLCASIATKLLGMKLLWHEHNIQPPGFRRRIITFLANILPDKIIAVSNAVRKSYLPYIRHPEKIITVHNGISIEVLHEAKESSTNIRKEFGIPEKMAIVGMMSVLRPWKGHEYFLKAATFVKKEYPNVNFLIVGEEPLVKDKGYKKYLIDLSNQMGISDSVIFTGFRQDVVGILSQIDILVSASVLPDPFPTIILESMALGVPIVATNVGGVVEMIEDEITGYLVPPGDAVEMGGKILRLLNEPEKKREMGLKGKERAKHFFTVKKFINGIENVYESLLGE
jgi:glycosyltransferase involved in cell wall biosynthesis